MLRGSFILLGLLAPSLGTGCGLDWTLPQAHFDGVEEHGYVAYWEKIGEADLGDGLVIPVNIGFNSHGEASSPTLGKGWTVALLESHVIPVDENCMKVVMPDGWTFTFLRNGDTQTWRGNAGWVGETSNTVFTITAPCGWRVKYDGGKIQEIESNKNRTLTYKYNGSVATEVDTDGKPFVQIQNNPAPGVQAALMIGQQRVDLSLAQRPRIQSIKNQNLVTGFDQSLSQLQWPDGKTDKTLDPTLTITHADQTKRNFTWDATTKQIKTDGGWTYKLKRSGDHLAYTRTNFQGKSETYSTSEATGVTIQKNLDGVELATSVFNSGTLAGRIRKIEETGGTHKTLYSASYFPSGSLMREIVYPDRVRLYSEKGALLKETVGDTVIYERDYDKANRLIHVLNPGQQIEVKRTYNSKGGEITQVFKQGMLLYTETADNNNNLTSFDKGYK
jgi:hypothetical protein